MVVVYRVWEAEKLILELREPRRVPGEPDVASFHTRLKGQASRDLVLVSTEFLDCHAVAPRLLDQSKLKAASLYVDDRNVPPLLEPLDGRKNVRSFEPLTE